MSGSGYVPGDIIIDYVRLSSPRGGLDLTNIMMSGEIYESIFTPGIVAKYLILDTEDYIGQLQFSGDEIISISFRPPGGQTNVYDLNLNSVTDSTPEGSQKSKIYTLNCVSKESFNARANPVTKSYNTQISSMLQDIFSNYLKSSKPIFVEATKGIQKFLSPNIKPLELIKQLKQRASSLSNSSSVFTFFENKNGYNFVTFQSLFNNSVIKDLVRLDTIPKSIYNLSDNNIISHYLVRQGSSIDRIGLGALNNQIQTFDLRTHKYQTKNNNPSEKDFGIVGAISSAFFKSLFGNSPGKTIMVQKDSMNPETYLSDSSGNKDAYLSALMQNQLNIEVPGDTAYYAGGCVNTRIPKMSASTGAILLDPLMNGKFLISKLAHIIKKPNERPRYVNSMQLIKVGLENGV